MSKYIYTIFLMGIMMIACASDDIIEESSIENDNIELSFLISSFVKGAKYSTPETSFNEETVENLYVFLFPTTDLQVLKKYSISKSAFAGGSWSKEDNKVLLNFTQAEAGNRYVYVVANYSPELETALDGVATIEELQLVLQSSDTPWSPRLAAPILMSGNSTHNFNSSYQLCHIPLVRSLSKVQLNIKLSVSHQELPISAEGITQYKYKLINFDKNTYAFKPTSKEKELISLVSWVNWKDEITSYTLDSNGKVIGLTLTTYLNESEDAETAIELSLPYTDGGFLPPPEFGDEIYKLQMPTKIERNHWYVYDVEI